MKPAIIVVDMVKDNFHDEDHLPITAQARAMIPALNRLMRASREKGAPVIFACDSFLEGDFIFQGKMKAHSLRGTPGAEVLEDLDRTPGGHLPAQAPLQRLFQDRPGYDPAAAPNRYGGGDRHCHPFLRVDHRPGRPMP